MAKCGPVKGDFQTWCCHYITCAVSIILLFSLDIIETFPVLRQKDIYQSSYNFEWLKSDSLFSDDILSRVKRSNSSQGPQYANAVEEFYADPNNRAMFLVLPLIILVYGGCGSIYCIHKCCRYVKRKKSERNLKKHERIDSPSASCAIEDIQENVLEEPQRIPSPVYVTAPAMRKAIIQEPSPPPAYDSTERKFEPLPMVDLEREDDVEKVSSKPKDPVTPKKKSEKYDKEINQQNETSFIENQKSPIGNGAVDKKQVRVANEQKGYSRPSSKSSSQTTTTTTSDSKQKSSPELSESKAQQLLQLTPKDIEDILNYYSDKKHMPDVIPDDTENLVPLRRKARKWKYRVFNT